MFTIMSLSSEPFHVGNFSISIPASWIWTLLLVIIVLNNFKCLPLAWHIRLLRGFRYLLRSNQPKHGPTPAQLFQPLIISSGNSLMELDYNMHKSNSTYFADLDIARCHLMCTLFARGVDYARNAPHRSGILGVSDDLIGLALGAVSCHFRKEVKPCQRYEIWTRVLSWDEKWMYIVTHFVRKDAARPRSFTLLSNNRIAGGGGGGGALPRQGHLSDLSGKEDAIFASALSKCVWKKGRRTVPPEIMLQVSGLLPARPGQEDLVATLRSEPLGKLTFAKQAEEYYDIPFKMLEKIENARDTLRAQLSLLDEPEREEEGFSRRREGRRRGMKDMNEDHHRYDTKEGEEEWTWDRVELQRQRGMEIAKNLAQLDRLHAEFTTDTDALALRRDLW